MNEQNRLRLDRIATRHAKQTAQGRSQSESEADAEFLGAFSRVRDDVLRPVMAEVGAQLEAAGYDFRVSPGGEEGSPAVDFHILIPDRGDSKDTIRFFAQKDAAQGWQVIAELELKRSPFELTRFEANDQITRDVAEQLIVDAVEQMFASTTAPPKPGATESAPADAPVTETAGMPAEESEQVVAGEPARGGEGAPRLFELLAAPGQGPDPPLPPLPAPEMRWAGWAGVQGMGETEEADVSMFRGAALPFAKGRPPPAFFAAADAARAESRHSPGSTMGHETMMLPVVDLPGPAGEKRVTEAKPAAAGDEARTWLTIEQYAAYCAELAGFPDQAAQIHRRYGVTGADARTALDDAFAQRFRADPNLRQRWQALVVHYREWYRGRALCRT